MPQVDQREHILQVAAQVFAARGFHGASIREISSTAKVNVSMVHYYFGSKEQLLDAIFERFFQELGGLLRSDEAGPTSASHPDPETDPGRVLSQMAVRLPNLLVPMIRRNETFFRVVLGELVLHHPDHREMIARHLQSALPHLYGPLYGHFMEMARRGEPLRVGPRKIRLDIAGPAMGGMVFSHFLLGAIVQRVTGLEYGEDFLQEYQETLSGMIVNALMGENSGGTV